MPEVDVACLCEHVRIEPAGGVAHVVAACMDTLTVPQVPAGINLAILLRITFALVECDRPHRIEIICQDEDGGHIMQINSTVTPARPTGVPANWPAGSLTGLNFGLVVPKFGQYAFEILINDSIQKTLPFRVIQLQQPDAPEP
jgi:hypothetical protein